MEILNAKRPGSRSSSNCSNFQPRKFGPAISQNHTKQRSSFHPPPHVPAGALKHEHLCMVSLPEVGWWPCLVIPDIHQVHKIVENAMDATNFSTMQTEYVYAFFDAAKNTTDILHNRCNVTIRLGDTMSTQRCFFHLAPYDEQNVVSFVDGGCGFLQKMVDELKPTETSDATVSSAILQTQQILKYLFAHSSKNHNTTTAAATATACATTTNNNTASKDAALTVIEKDSASSEFLPSPRKRSRSFQSSAVHATSGRQVETSAQETTLAVAPARMATNVTTTTGPAGRTPLPPTADMERETTQIRVGTTTAAPAARPLQLRAEDDALGGRNDDSTVSTCATTTTTGTTTTTTGKKRKRGRSKSNKSKAPQSSKRSKSPPPHTPTKKLNYKATGGYLNIPSWPSVRNILEDCGYEFDSGLYARPFGNPQRYPNAVLGTDYFETEISFKAFCCAHGFDYVSVAPSDKDQELVNLWSRYSILGDIFWENADGGEANTMTKIPELRMAKRTATGVLRRKLGFRFGGGRQLVSGYHFPGDDESVFMPDNDMWLRLARFGLPKECSLERVGKEELLAVLQCIISSHVATMLPDFEQRTAPHDDRNTMDSFGQGEQEDAHCHTASPGTMTPMGDSEAIADCHRAPEAAAFVGNVCSNLGRNFDQQAPSSPLQPMHNTDAGADDVATDEPNEHMDFTPAVEEPNEVFFPQSELNPNVELPGNTVEEKLQSCLDAMSASYDDALVIGGSLSIALNDLGLFMKQVVDSRGLMDNAFIHVCGAPGVGKTLGVRACVQKVNEYWDKEKERCIEKSHVEAPRFVFLKGSEFQNLTKAQAMQKTFEHVGGNPKQLRRPNDLDRSSKAAVFLVLDEIDMLLSKAGTEEYLRSIVGLAADENMRLGLIGISNSVDNIGLSDLGFSGTRIVFRTYDKDDLVRIITSKIGTSVVDEKTLEFLAKKVAAASGDARTMLGLVATAVEASREMLKEPILSASLSGPVVKIPHAMAAVKKQNPKTKDLIESLPKFEKFTLWCLVNFSKSCLDKEVTLGCLFDNCKRAFGVDCSHTIEDFKGIVERLIDTSLLKLNVTPLSGTNDSTQTTLSFDMQLEEVVSALEEGVGAQEFYQRMKSRCHLLQ